MTGSDPIDAVPVSDRPRRATPWSGLGIGVGLLSIVIGLLVLFWPGASVVVIAWLFAIQLIVSGILQFVAAFMDDLRTGTGAHVLMGLLGALSIVVGLLCLRAPRQTAVVPRTAHRSDLGDRWCRRDRARDRCGSGRPSWLAYHLRGALRAWWGRRSGLSMVELRGHDMVVRHRALADRRCCPGRELHDSPGSTRAFAEAGGRHSSAAAPSST
jgi:Short repeat of unknown function (DUF308)